MSTAKRLVDDGVDPTQRLKAMPVAVRSENYQSPQVKPIVSSWYKMFSWELQLRALGVSTVICSAVGACAWVAFRQTGVGIKPVVEVASLHETIALAQRQRVSFTMASSVSSVLQCTLCRAICYYEHTG